MSDPQFMRRALDLVEETPHRTSPNPKVGCVIVRDGRVVAEGVTQAPGQAHAEVVALLAAGEAARGADMYVTLEPCCHVGRTPPCTDAILAAGIARVFCGIKDPNPLVDGGGLRQLRDTGLHVELGLLEEACAHQLAPFGRFIVDKRPWFTLKAAITLDGRIATASGDSRWITGELARADVHALRARCDAVLIGSGTALADNPRLTVRDAPGDDPVRIVLDSSLRLTGDAKLATSGTIVIHGPDATERPDLVDAGVELVAVDASDRGLDLSQVAQALAAKGLIRVMVEGGGRIHGSFLKAGLADEGWFYVAPKMIGEGRPVFAIDSVDQVVQGWRIDVLDTARLGDDVRIRGPIRYPAAPTED